MFRFSPAGDGKGAKYEIPEIYHWANVFGARIQMYGFQGLPPVTTFKLTFTKDRGDSLELDFTPAPNDPFLLIKLCVEGTGAAWFDDLELVEVAR